MKSKPELARLIVETKRRLKETVRDLEKAEHARASIPESDWPLTWPNLTSHVNALKLVASQLRVDLDRFEKAYRERRPAIVRVYYDDLELDDSTSTSSSGA